MPAADVFEAGRSMIDSLRSSGAASAAAKAGPSKFVSRIHVADMAQVVLASMRRPSRRSIYNVADDRPAPRSEVEQFALQVLLTPLHAARAVQRSAVLTERRLAGLGLALSSFFSSTLCSRFSLAALPHPPPPPPPFPFP
eukprot:418825-Rhodomonas_salina.1